MQIDHVDGNGEVTFQDGTSVHADIILHCTGYNPKHALLFLSFELFTSLKTFFHKF